MYVVTSKAEICQSVKINQRKVKQNENTFPILWRRLNQVKNVDLPNENIFQENVLSFEDLKQQQQATCLI